MMVLFLSVDLRFSLLNVHLAKLSFFGLICIICCMMNEYKFNNIITLKSDMISRHLGELMVSTFLTKWVFLNSATIRGSDVCIEWGLFLCTQCTLHSIFFPKTHHTSASMHLHWVSGSKQKIPVLFSLPLASGFFFKSMQLKFTNLLAFGVSHEHPIGIKAKLDDHSCDTHVILAPHFKQWNSMLCKYKATVE